MFGTSESTFSEKYVRWGIRLAGNEELRQQYIAETRPLLEKVGQNELNKYDGYFLQIVIIKQLQIIYLVTSV